MDSFPGTYSRTLYRIAGWVCVSLGAAGALLPVVPTTPFLIAGLWCFTRGSPALAERLLNHPHFGAALRQWQEQGAIPGKVKAFAVASMAGSWIIVWITTSGVIVPSASGVIMASVAAYILTRPAPRN